MDTIELTCQIDTSEVVEVVSCLPVRDAFEFIMAIDESMADEGFTLGLMKKLAESMLKEYEGSLEYVTGKVTDRLFSDESELLSNSWWKVEDMENYDRAHILMGKIISAIDSLTNGMKGLEE